jgi:hypothetical protein
MRNTKLAALAVTVILILGASALAQDWDRDGDDRGSSAQARNYGYQNGYHDGYSRGRDEGRENDPFDYRTPDWRQATHGYKGWMGPLSAFQSGYQQGYREGFQSGLTSLRPAFRLNDGDRDDQEREFQEVDIALGHGPAFAPSSVAREDLARGKRFNPNPRGPYDDRDHGYRREYGNKNYYKQQYTDGYRTGYQSAFGRRY